MGPNGGGCARPGGVAFAALPMVLTALVFHSRTMSVGSAAATDVAGISVDAATRAIAVTVDSQRRAFDRCGDGFMMDSLVLDRRSRRVAPWIPRVRTRPSYARSDRPLASLLLPCGRP